MKALRRGRVVDQAQFHRVRLVRLETGEFYNTRRRAEDAVRTNRVVHVLLGDADALLRLRLGDQAPLDLNLILPVRRRLVAEARFKWLSSLQPVPPPVLRRRQVSVTSRMSSKTTLTGKAIDTAINESHVWAHGGRVHILIRGQL